ncbi:MAG TPA: glycosyl hydrolase 43 family protein [Verrucomicrobia bacterium]|nr:glycosyl hydrolase 43 family protein [Verrucomicrobiota bacterium]HOB32510.1 glycoside hydrolase 43 family protein [Verrucomicrobiota bacterium]HOP96304.1 glycoside hydrolase 43 family protein [Verrucomicrobiota bacterium]
MQAATPTPAQPRGEVSAAYPWVPDLGNATFRNPILHADYSDPDAIRHGEDFYMTASSFNCTPGLPILHSRDLVNWTIIGHALKNLPHPRYEQVQPGCGAWAPAIRYHDGRFWIFFPTPDEGIYVVTAENPRGPWSEPRLIEAGKGLIDPCPLWDDDGRAYLVHAYARSRSGLCDQLRVRPMSWDATRLLGDGQIVFHSPETHPTLEGPKFLKRNGWYYILAPAGGVTNGWQVALRSRNIFGPYESRKILERGSTTINGPHQGALVDLPNGDWWFLHFQDAGVYGRIVHLQPVTWQDDWPLAGHDHDGNGIGEPVARWRRPAVNEKHAITIPQTSDDFDSARLGFQWQWQANHKENWYSLTDRKGCLRLFAQQVKDANLLAAPNLLLQKFPARVFEVETALEFSATIPGDEAGLVVTGKTCGAIAIRRAADGSDQVVYRENGADHYAGVARGKPVKFRVRVKDGGLCTFGFDAGEGLVSVAPAFQATAGFWIGAKVGIYCISRETGPGAYADFDYVRFSG